MSIFYPCTIIVYFLRVCCFNNILTAGGTAVEEEREAYEEGEAGSNGLGFEEAVAVAVVTFEYIFAPLCGGVLQIIIGFCTAKFAAVLSNFSCDISGGP